MSKKDINNTDYSSRGLMWKLLRKHISKSQLIGFSLASLVGLTIVILAVQFHQDVKPLFKDEDSFLVGCFPRLLPQNVLEGKKEGDVLKFHCPEYNVDIELMCNQLGYRYGRVGKFAALFFFFKLGNCFKGTAVIF